MWCSEHSCTQVGPGLQPEQASSWIPVRSCSPPSGCKGQGPLQSGSAQQVPGSGALAERQRPAGARDRGPCRAASPGPHTGLTAAPCWLLFTRRASSTSFSSKPISMRATTACTGAHGGVSSGGEGTSPSLSPPHTTAAEDGLSWLALGGIHRGPWATPGRLGLEGLPPSSYSKPASAT